MQERYAQVSRTVLRPYNRHWVSKPAAACTIRTQPILPVVHRHLAFELCYEPNAKNRITNASLDTLYLSRCSRQIQRSVFPAARARSHTTVHTQPRKCHRVSRWKNNCGCAQIRFFLVCRLDRKGCLMCLAVIDVIGVNIR